MSNKVGALSGIRVVTCSTAQAGTVPYMLMADLGAEVIKIEVPGTGDGSRRSGEIKNGVSSFFETNNRGSSISWVWGKRRRQDSTRRYVG